MRSGVGTESKASRARADRAAWTRPELKRISAGYAEQGGKVKTDLGVAFS